jgi:hypothetical protein
MTTAERQPRSQASFALRELLRALAGGFLRLWRAVLRALETPLSVLAAAAKTVTPLGWPAGCSPPAHTCSAAPPTGSTSS